MRGIADDKIPVFPSFFSNFGFRVQSLSHDFRKLKFSSCSLTRQSQNLKVKVEFVGPTNK